MSEETEVKNIEWLKKEIHKELEDWHGVEGGIDGDGINEIMLLINQHEESEVKRLERKIKELESFNDFLIRGNNQFRNELDKLEVLSQEWIDENKKYNNVHDIGYYISVNKLYGKIVPKQEERVSKTCELKPVVPQFVADHIEEVKASGDSLDDAYALLRGIYHQSKVADWMAEDKNNSETFARAWLDGYEVEEEQKYYVKDEKGNVLLKKVTKGFGIDDRKGEIVNSSNVGELSDFRLTEKEIKDYDPRYMVFAKPVEELEE